jgi:hypothetical protein
VAAGAAARDRPPGSLTIRDLLVGVGYRGLSAWDRARLAAISRLILANFMRMVLAARMQRRVVAFRSLEPLALAKCRWQQPLAVAHQKTVWSLMASFGPRSRR